MGYINMLANKLINVFGFDFSKKYFSEIFDVELSILLGNPSIDIIKLDDILKKEWKDYSDDISMMDIMTKHLGKDKVKYFKENFIKK